MLGSDGGGGEGGGSASAAAALLCVLPSRDMTATMLRQACFICLGTQYRRYRNFWQGWPQGKLPVSLSGRPSCRSGRSLWSGPDFNDHGGRIVTPGLGDGFSHERPGLEIHGGHAVGQRMIPEPVDQAVRTKKKPVTRFTSDSS